VLIRAAPELAFDQPLISANMIVSSRWRGGLGSQLSSFSGPFSLPVSLPPSLLFSIPAPPHPFPLPALEHVFRRPVRCCLARPSRILDLAGRMETDTRSSVSWASGIRPWRCRSFWPASPDLVGALRTSTWPGGKDFAGAFAGAICDFTGNVGRCAAAGSRHRWSRLGMATPDEPARNQIVSGTRFLGLDGLTALTRNAIWSQGQAASPNCGHRVLNTIDLP